MPVVSLAKGFEPDTMMRMTEIVEEVLPDRPVGVLTGLQKFPALAPIRDAEDLSEDFQKLWADVEALKQRAEAAIK